MIVCAKVSDLTFQIAAIETAAITVFVLDVQQYLGSSSFHLAKTASASETTRYALRFGATDVIGWRRS